jgi:DNA-binding CsgD family transcriptional regulator
MSTALTPRENQILKLLVNGERPRQIAKKLYLSVKTVEAHKYNLMRKLDLHSVVELVHYAIRIESWRG